MEILLILPVTLAGLMAAVVIGALGKARAAEAARRETVKVLRLVERRRIRGPLRRAAHRQFARLKQSALKRSEAQPTVKRYHTAPHAV